MPASTLFNRCTSLKSYECFIDDIGIPIDDVLSLEFADDLFNYGTRGLLIIKDTFNLANSGRFKTSTNLEVSYTIFDFSGTRKKYVFSVLDMDVIEAARVNLLVFKLVDPFWYKLSTLYLTKSFDGTVTDAFKKIVQNYGLESELSKNGLSLDVGSGGESKKFVMSSDRSVLTMLLQEFRLANLLIWQDHEKLHVKEFQAGSAEGPLTGATGKPIEYSNVCANEYAFKIHDFSKSGYKRSTTTTSPLQEVIRFKNKEVITDTVNLTDFYSSMMLNGDDVWKDMQDTKGKLFNTNVDGIDAQKYDLFKDFIRNEELLIVVAGFIKFNKLGCKADVRLGARTMYDSDLTLGDRRSSGTYLITKVQSKIMSGRFIQRLRLSRFDRPRI